MTAVARRDGRDDYLFLDEQSQKYYSVHLTWSIETDPFWPNTTEFSDFNEFFQNWRKIFD